MQIPKGLKLDVFIFKTDEQRLLQAEGLPIDLNECYLADYTFYDISYLYPTEHGLTTICSDGSEFLINDTLVNVQRKIQEALFFPN